MISFREKVPKKVPGLSTASLPDIIFMLLFFFMISTTIRENPMIVRVRPPSATEVQKMEKKSLVSYIYVGKPGNEARFGTVTRIQLNDAFQPVENIGEFISKEREDMVESDRNRLIVSIKADKDVEMGIITDIKQELRKAEALIINYSAAQGTREAVFDNF
ncbi:MAG: biopolymer transporter ExbD [Bacteroidales bacterium]|nr:biopolymer transporter ExbD [Bacteroidales bacterium]